MEQTPFKLAMCQESFTRAFNPNIAVAPTWTGLLQGLREAGFDGIEVAPAAFSPPLVSMPYPARRELRRQAEAAGIKIVGAHWLLAKTTGLHLTRPECREPTVEYLMKLVDAVSDLGGMVVVHGSPKERSFDESRMSLAEALGNAAEVLKAIARVCQESGILYCFEPLGSDETNFVNSLEQAAALVAMVNHPNVRVHLDVKAMWSECQSSAGVCDLIRQYGAVAGHFHANDVSGFWPGTTKQIDHAAVFAALRESGYQGWVSLEPFDAMKGKVEDPMPKAVETVRFLREQCGC